MLDTAIDSSVLVAYLNGENAADIETLQKLMDDDRVFLPPVALSEILSYPGLNSTQRDLMLAFPLLPLEEGYWQRVGESRARLLSKRHKAHLPDTLIAQSCIDHNMPLLTRDKDFQPFADLCGLKLALPPE